MLFNGAMVRALLDGRKTQTRRIAKPVRHPDFGTFGIGALASEPKHVIERACPFGQPGDRIWVRETWQLHSRATDVATVVYKASRQNSWTEMHQLVPADLTIGNTVKSFQDGWRPSIHMPRWASRITLEITDVRIERLQDISEADAAAEGARAIECDHVRHSCEEIGCFGDTHKAAFRGIWESTGGDWNANPWVWVIEFKKLEA